MERYIQPLNYERLGQRLREHRRRCGMSQLELSRRSGVPLRTLRQIEHGDARDDNHPILILACAMNMVDSRILEPVFTAETSEA